MKLILIMVLLEDLMLPCLTKKYFGVDCPGCGLQRSIAFLIKGDVAAAWDMYPAIFTIIPLVGVFAASQFIKIKYVNKIIFSLLIISLILILTNYISKFN